MKFFLCLLLTTALVTGERLLKNPGELNSVLQTEDVGGATPEVFYPTNPADQLYFDVAEEYYDHALTAALEVEHQSAENLKNAILHLVKDRRVNVATFAIKLAAAGRRDLVENYFPPEYRIVFNDRVVKLINNKYPLKLQLQEGIDFVGDKGVIGNDKIEVEDNYVWKFEPIDEGTKVYFRIRHRDTNRYLKLGTWSDAHEAHQLYASPASKSDTTRHHWLLQPVYYKGKLSFCIINREYYQAIRYSPEYRHENRIVYSLGGAFYDKPDEFGWQVDNIEE